MADKRISALTEKTSLGASDYLVTDNASEAASKKVKTSYITDQLAVMQNILGAKNQLSYPYTHTTKAENGLTFTDLGNGKVTVSGTATAETTFYLGNTNAFADKDAGTYILSGCPEGGNRSSGYFLEISGRATASDNWTTIATDIGAGATFTITTEMLSWVSIHVFIRVRSGKAISTPITYAPMIRLASIKDDTYVPYAKTNKEITDELGSTDISSIGNGTVTGGISSLNSALNDQLYPDYSNNIRTNVSTVDMTVNTSSFLIAKISNNGNTLYDGGILVNNRQIGHVSNGETVTICIPIKKGSSVKTRNLSNVSYNVWMWGA